MPGKNLFKSIGYAIIASLTNALMAALIKIELERGIDPQMIIFWRAVWGLFFLTPAIIYSGIRKKTLLAWFKMPQWKLLALRSITGFLAFFLFFYSLRRLSLATATLLFFTMPLFMPFVGWLWKRVAFPKLSWIGLLVGFIGVILVVRPGDDTFTTASVVGLLSGLVYAIGKFAANLLSPVEPHQKINFYYLLTLSLLALPLTFHKGTRTWEELSKTDLFAFFGIGMFGVGYLSCATIAFRYGTPNIVSACLYMIVVFALLLDWLIWQIVPHWFSLLGGALVVLGVLIKIYFYHRESRQME